MVHFARRGADATRHRLSGSFALLAALAGACTFDPDDRCGPYQRIYGDNEACICVEGAVLTAIGCIPCGEHEVPGNGACACEPGYTRAAAGAPCEPAPEALGAACSADKPCADATYNHCQPASNQTGYCTNVGCTSSSECSSGYACSLDAQPSFCMRPPLGLGKSCTSAADCADGEATFCETFMTHACQVQGCTLSPNDCFAGFVCTDLSMFGLPNLCVPGGAP